DIACTPVIYAYAVVTINQLYYYIDPAKVTEKVKVYLEERGVTLRPYDALGDDLEKYHGKNIWVSLSGLNTDLFECIAKDNYFITEPSPITLFRAVKNDIEIKNTKNAHIKDGVAMVKFIRWIKENVGKMDLDEVKAQNYLYDLRKQGKLYIEPSFPTICAYQANGAMMHYSATEDNYAKIKNRGFLLVDSGGTYKDGTTDITRTIALNKLTNEEKKLYTKVLQGHLALSRAKFLQGTAGNNLDILARRPLWDMDIDYQCGTGHGVGHVMSVHEGPHSIRWGIATTARPAVALVPGMIVTNEPGVYIPHKLGIRIENEMLVVKGNKNFYGQFLGFETITYCPYDLDAIDPKYLEEEDIKQINSYHQMVYATLAPYLDAKDKSWLKKATKRIGK
ncbi:MAG: aminopeptidase P family protein, partial [Solobacterium sp.]|nr:aminopeptidase P family protein [Solobacterium sp.]